MQKITICLFVLLSFVLKSQTIDVKNMEFSIWFEDTTAKKLHCRALLTIEHSIDTINLDFHPTQINYVQLREGRLKGGLSYSKQGEQLLVHVPSKYGKSTIEIDYQLNLEDPYYESLINRKQIPLGLNAQNITEDMELGVSGSFFPSLKGDFFTFKANLTTIKGLNSGTLGTLEYVIKHNGKVQSQFWSTKAKVTAAAFYLVFGEFKEFDAEDFEEDYDLSPPDLTAFQIQDERSASRSILAHIKKEFGKEISDSLILKLDSLAEFNFNNPIFSIQHLPRDYQKKSWNKELILLKEIFLDSAEAWLRHFEYHTSIHGQDWSKGYLDVKWKEIKLQTDSSLVNPYLFKIITERWHPYSPLQTKERELMLQQLATTNVPPVVDINYNYRDGKEYVFVKQDTSISRPINIPFSIRIYSKDTVQEFTGVSGLNAVDTLEFPQKGAPQAIQLYIGENFPGTLTLPRSDIYDLYLMSNAKDPQERKLALQRLFLTTNLNLFSTVLGIAMDSKDPKIREEAVDRAGNLNTVAQYKLKDTLLGLSQKDEVLNIRFKAQKLVEKYYPEK